VQTLRKFCAKTLIVVISVKPEHEKAARELVLDGFISKQLPPELFIAALNKIITQ
jgi:hypothetical protein